MLRLESIIGSATEPAIAERLHHLGHHGKVEYLFLSSEDTQRHRMRASTDAGTECAVVLDRAQHLFNGAVLLLNGNAVEAEKVFREDLDRNPRNPRSLFGLSEALRAQNRAYDAQFVDKQFQSNWKTTEIKLKVADLT